MAKVKSIPMMTEKDWQLADDARTLTQAAEIVADKGRLAKVQTHLKEKSADVEKLLSGLRRRT